MSNKDDKYVIVNRPAPLKPSSNGEQRYSDAQIFWEDMVFIFLVVALPFFALGMIVGWLWLAFVQ